MIVYILIVAPLVIAGIAMLFPSNKIRPWFIPLNALIHSFFTIFILIFPEYGSNNPWLILDPVGKIILISVSALYLFCSFFTVGYLKFRLDRSNRVFTASLIAFIGLLTLVIWSHHLGLMWVAIEGTTLVSAPLIYFNKSKRSIEATWKYLVVGSVGIALALLGTFFIAYSAIKADLEPTLHYDTFLNYASFLSKPWLKVAFIFLLVGYGTKMGLAPMHTWKPDAYGEAPGVVGALLAGGVTSGAFIALTRFYHICNMAGESQFTSRLLIIMGILSMATAGIFMISQRDFKRMLAYSSIEHMGILSLGLGIGIPALFGTLLHVMTNAMTKGVLFLSAGNIHRSYESKNTEQVMGAIKFLPISGTLFLVGFLAITGSPPFGPFISIFSILNGAFEQKHFLTGALFLFFLLIVFIGMSITVLKVVYGNPPEDLTKNNKKENILTVLPIFIFLIVVLMLGIYIPEPLKLLLKDAAIFLGGRL